jgi:hypothetical protein
LLYWEHKKYMHFLRGPFPLPGGLPMSRARLAVPFVVVALLAWAFAHLGVSFAL